MTAGGALRRLFSSLLASSLEDTTTASSRRTASALVDTALDALDKFRVVGVDGDSQEHSQLADGQQQMPGGYVSFKEDCEQLPLREAVERLERRGVRAGFDTYATLLRRCSRSGSLLEGRRVHAHIAKSKLDGDRFLGNLLMEMYGKCGDVRQVRAAFDAIKDRNVYSWTIVITAYAQNGHPQEALHFFHRMQHEGVAPNNHTFSIVISASASLGVLAPGRAIHASICESGFDADVFVGNSLLDMYRKCGSLDDAKKVFSAMGTTDQVSWTSIIVACVQLGHYREAFEFLKKMDLEGIPPDKMTYASLVDGCASLAALAQGKKLHARIAAVGLELDIVLETAILNMYAKCGRLVEASNMFNSIREKNVITWTAMIAAYAHNGDCKKALQLFWKMEQEGERASGITFVPVLYACSHAGLMDQAYYYFTTLGEDRNVQLVAEHYGCIIDLLGRAGWLAEAEDLIKKMRVPADAVSWTTLLGACKIHGDMVRAERAAERVFELNPNAAAPYILLSNIYSEAGRWDLAGKLRRKMDDKQLKKPAGRSWVEVNDKVHEFVVGDKSHPQMTAIFAELQRLNKLMKEAGYVPDTKVVLHNAEEEEKEDMLFYHSEKLAIVLGLLNCSPEEPVRIVKNLRVCSDCHAATKFITKVVGRQIIVRDAKRFHYFEDGKCSCGDYW